jgi:polyhydroxybutyrate depolymerase
MTVVRRWLLGALVLALVSACDSASDRPTPTIPSPTAPATGTVKVDLGERPFRLHIPDSYDPATKIPLVVLLHGYRASAAIQEQYFKLTAESDRRGFLYALPDGTADGGRRQFWNASDACCDMDRSGVDDSAYLSSLIDKVTSSYAVDTARVYLVGHSNGGFMAHRMACDHADQVTAIVSLAGAITNDPARCRPGRPVSVLQIHGTDDRTIQFGGGNILGRAFPSVATTLATWRRLDGCANRPDRSADAIDLDSRLAGSETTVTIYAAGCRAGSRVELWTIRKGSHVPALTDDFAPKVMDFLLARTA